MSHVSLWFLPASSGAPGLRHVSIVPTGGIGTLGLAGSGDAPTHHSPFWAEGSSAQWGWAGYGEKGKKNRARRPLGRRSSCNRQHYFSELEVGSYWPTHRKEQGDCRKEMSTWLLPQEKLRALGEPAEGQCLGTGAEEP